MPAADAGTVLWRGVPRLTCYMLRGWWLPASIGLWLLAVGILWEWATLGGRHALILSPIGAPLVVLGAYAIAVRPLLLRRVAGDLRYEVTRDSVSLRRAGSDRAVWSLPADALPPAAVVASWPGTDLAFFGVPGCESRWGPWRLVDDRPRFSCLSDDAAAAALAAVEGLRREGGVTSARAWARGLVTPRSSRLPSYDPQPPASSDGA